jgi:hypothetical protein
MLGTVFNIQRFSLHDGPGIHTTVFLKGCSLHCFWCHNPEGLPQARDPILPERCITCGACVGACDHGGYALPTADRGSRAVRSLGRLHRHPLRRSPLRGQERAPRRCLNHPAGPQYYASSNGGVTLSGGEPALQPEFSRELLALRPKAFTAGDGRQRAVGQPGRLPHRPDLDGPAHGYVKHRAATVFPMCACWPTPSAWWKRPTSHLVSHPVVPGVNDSRRRWRRPRHCAPDDRPARRARRGPHRGIALSPAGRRQVSQFGRGPRAKTWCRQANACSCWPSRCTNRSVRA